MNSLERAITLIKNELVETSIDDLNFVSARIEFQKTGNIKELAPIVRYILSKNKNQEKFSLLANKLFTENEIENYTLEIEDEVEGEDGEKYTIIPLYDLDISKEDELLENLVDKFLEQIISNKEEILNKISEKKPIGKQLKMEFA